MIISGRETVIAGYCRRNLCALAELSKHILTLNCKCAHCRDLSFAAAKTEINFANKKKRRRKKETTNKQKEKKINFAVTKLQPVLVSTNERALDAAGCFAATSFSAAKTRRRPCLAKVDFNAAKLLRSYFCSRESNKVVSAKCAFE